MTHELKKAAEDCDRFLRMLAGVAELGKALHSVAGVSQARDEAEKRLEALRKDLAGAEANLAAAKNTAAAVVRDAEAHAAGVREAADKLKREADVRQRNLGDGWRVLEEARAAHEEREAKDLAELDARENAVAEREAAVAAKEAALEAKAAEVAKASERIKRALAGED